MPGGSYLHLSQLCAFTGVTLYIGYTTLLLTLYIIYTPASTGKTLEKHTVHSTMALITLPFKPFILITMWILFYLTTAAVALPTSLTTPGAAKAVPRACTNHLTNPSFESGAVDPWLTIVTSAWSTRGVFENFFTHSGTHHYYAHSTSTVDSTLTLSQTNINTSVGTTVDCYAWVAGKRTEGMTDVEVFLDGVSCGQTTLGVGDPQWKRVGSRVRVTGTGNGMGSTIAIVATSGSAGEEGWEVWVDDVGVVSC